MPRSREDGAGIVTVLGRERCGYDLRGSGAVCPECGNRRHGGTPDSHEGSEVESTRLIDA